MSKSMPSSIFLLKSDLDMHHKRGTNIGGLKHPCVGEESEEYILASDRDGLIEAAVGGMLDLVWGWNTSFEAYGSNQADLGIIYWVKRGTDGVFTASAKRMSSTVLHVSGLSSEESAKAVANAHHHKHLTNVLKGE